MSYINSEGQTVLQGDGSYGFEVIVDGEDLVVRGARVTWFGGADDSEDSGSEASGYPTLGHPEFQGCALPMPLTPRTFGSPLPVMPWGVHADGSDNPAGAHVRVWSHSTQKTIVIPVSDLGPAKPPFAHAQIDLTEAAFDSLNGPGSARAQGEMVVDYRVIGGAKWLNAA